MPYQDALYYFLLGLLPAIGLIARPQFVVGFAALGFVLSLADWTRFRPFFYQYTTMLIVLAVCPPSEGLNCCRLIHVSIYFWSGVLKVNPMFFKTVFPAMIQPVARRLPSKVPWAALAYSAPALEAFLALALLFPAWRAAGLLAALAMHVLIMFCYSRYGDTSLPEILPWNVSMLSLDVVLFANTGSISAGDILTGRASLAHLLVLGLFALLPCLGLFNRLDPVFTHGHMSGRHVMCYVCISERLLKKLPPEIQAACVRMNWVVHMPHVLDISAWYRRGVGTAAPQQEKLLLAIANDLKRYGARPRNCKIVIGRMVGWRSPSVPQVLYDLT